MEVEDVMLHFGACCFRLCVYERHWVELGVRAGAFGCQCFFLFFFILI